MRQYLLAGVAMALMTSAGSAADLPRRADPPVFAATPAFNWTGVFIGSHTSYLFSDRQRITSTGDDPFSQGLFALGVVPTTVTSRVDRLAKLGGGFGFNYQLTPGSGFVLGGKFDIDWTDANKTVAFTGAPLPAGLGGFPLTTVFNQSLDYLGTVNGRVGYAFDTVMVYATGGLAFGKTRYGASIYVPGPILATTAGDGGFETGFNYGGGVEIALPKGGLLDNFDVLKLIGINIGGSSTLKAEYIRYDLGGRSLVVPGPFPGASGTSRFHTEGSIVRAGFNYKFP